MCTFEYHDNHRCDLHKLANIEEKLDRKGLCLFHSRDIIWKRNNDFIECLKKLIDSQKEGCELDLGGVHFIGDDKGVINYIPLLGDVRLAQTTFHDMVYVKEEVVEERLEFESCNFKNDVIFKLCEFKKGVQFSKVEMSHLSSVLLFNFENCDFYNFFDFVEVNKEKFRANFVLYDCNFLEGDFQIDSFSTNEDQIFDIVGCEFYARFMISNSTINSNMSNLSDNYFEYDAEIHDTRFEGKVILNNIKVIKTLHFKGKKENKVFYGITYFELNPSDLVGRIKFDYVDISSIFIDDKNVLMSLEKEGKISIGAGCIKYRHRSNPRTFSVKDNNQSLIQEMTFVFSNYFIETEGINFGVEVKERTKYTITIFYFSDENISDKEFFRRLEQLQYDFADLISNLNLEKILEIPNEKQKLASLNALFSLPSIINKVAVRNKALQNWNSKESQALFQCITTNTDIVVVEQLAHKKINQVELNSALKSQISITQIINPILQTGKNNQYIEDQTGNNYFLDKTDESE